MEVFEEDSKRVVGETVQRPNVVRQCPEIENDCRRREVQVHDRRANHFSPQKHRLMDLLGFQI